MDIIAGQIANVGEDGRLNIPVDLLRAVEWWKAATCDVVAELIRPEIIRIHPASDARPAIELLLSEISEASQQETAAVIADRYRALKLYSDGRLRFTKDVCPLLGFRLGEPTTLFVQPFPKFLEVVTLQFRADRLARTVSSTSIAIESR
jgi:hypothetical protein